MAFNRVVARGVHGTNPFADNRERQGQTIAEQFEEAIVVDVIVNNEHDEYAKDGYNAGSVKFRFLNTNYFRPDENLHWAFSMDANKSEYPLLNEVIYVFRGLNRFYYMRKFNVSNRPTTQGMFGVNEEAQPVGNAQTGITQMRQSVSLPHKPPAKDGTGLGKYFRDKKDVYRLKHLEGDVVYEGRSGQSIRFGSSWLDGNYNVTARSKLKPWQALDSDQSPNLLIRIGPYPAAERTVDTPFGQVIEDINRDKSSIWMVSDQIVPLKYSTETSGIHRISISDFPRRLDRNQIIINTDRFVINTKTDKILGHSALGIHWTTLQNFTIDADQDHITWTNRDRSDRVVGDWKTTIGKTQDTSVVDDITTKSGKNLVLSAKSNVGIIGSTVHVGTINDSNEPLVLGATLRDFLDQLLTILVLEPIVLTTGLPGAPSPQNPQRITLLQKLKAQYLTPGKTAAILSKNNFTVRDNDSPLETRTISPYSEG